MFFATKPELFCVPFFEKFLVIGGIKRITRDVYIIHDWLQSADKVFLHATAFAFGFKACDMAFSRAQLPPCAAPFLMTNKAPAQAGGFSNIEGGKPKNEWTAYKNVYAGLGRQTLVGQCYVEPVFLACFTTPAMQSENKHVRNPIIALHLRKQITK